MHINLRIWASHARKVRFQRVAIRAQIPKNGKALMPNFHDVTTLKIEDAVATTRLERLRFSQPWPISELRLYKKRQTLLGSNRLARRLL